MTIWERLKPQIGCYYDRVVCPTEAQLDAFEAQHGFKLPTSYRQFALTFGSGMLFTAQNRTDPVRELVMPGLVNISPYYDPARISRELLNTESALSCPRNLVQEL